MTDDKDMQTLLFGFELSDPDDRIRSVTLVRDDIYVVVTLANIYKASRSYDGGFQIERVSWI